MMAVDRKQLSEGKTIDLTRAYAESDRQMAVNQRTRALLAAAGMDGEKRWAILRVASRRENDVDKSLCAALIEHWLPLKKEEQNLGGRRTGGQGAPVWSLAWPGYMFVKVVDTAASWAWLAGVKHVRSVLGVGERPFFVSDDNLLRYKAELATLKDARLQQGVFLKGEQVHVISGPFAHHNATVTELGEGKQEGRARLEVLLFGRMVPIDLDLAQLAKG